MKIISWVLLAVVLFPVAALAFFKPSRVVAPEAFGARCPVPTICVDDVGKYAEAAELYRTSRAYLETRWGLAVGEPRIIFCATETCGQRFGVGRRAAYTAGTLAIVVSPRGWKDFYLEHELIHYWQAVHFGNLVLLNGKEWLIEGMAYALSNDTRDPLTQPFEGYRQTFKQWRERNSGKPLLQAVGEEL